MATNSIRRTGAGARGKADSKRSGIIVDPGPYEAVVQGHVIGTRMGQLIVTIPDWGGQTNVSNTGTGDGVGSNSDQIVVSYASPYYGSTFGADTGTNPNTPQTAGQSYGMWCVPPDIGNKVLVTFVAGDMSRGYWFACIYDSPSHHMVPGNARNIGGTFVPPPAAEGLNKYFNSNSVLPVVEYDISDPTAFTAQGLTTTPRFPHEFQAMHLVKQGLDADPVRGAISSSSMREAPSNVYGISTPGPLAAGAGSTQIKVNPQAVLFRQGGHTFVMDDGATGDAVTPSGTDQLIRLRTSGGHQILMNDTEGILYIASASGAQWLEFSNNGAINIYGAAGFNVRSKGAINMHSDSSINMCAPNINLDAIPGVGAISLPSISIKSTGKLSMSSVLATTITGDASLNLNSIGAVTAAAGGALSLSSVAGLSVTSAGLIKIGAQASVTIDGATVLLNCMGETSLSKPPMPAMPSLPHALPDTLMNGTNWIQGAVVLSTCSVVPAHEPWTANTAPFTSTNTSTTRPVLGTGLAAIL
jgi:hypothetical protein